MKLKKLLITLISAILISATPCLAEEISVTQDIETTKVTVDADFGSEYKNQKLMMYCLLDDTSISDIPGETDTVQKTDKICAISYGETDSEGKCTFSNIIVNGDNAEYVFYVTVSNSTKVFKSGAEYIVSKTTVDSFLDAITNAEADDILTALNNEVESKTIGLNILLYEGLNDDGREAAAALLENREFEGINNAVEEINKASVRAGLDNISSAESLDMLLYPDNYEQIAEFCEIIKAENGMDEYADNLAFKNLAKFTKNERIRILKNALAIKNTDNVFDKIIISVINYEIATCEGYGDVTGIIKSYYDADILSELDYSKYIKSKYKNNLNKKLLDESFDKVSELVDYIENYIANAGRVDTSSPSGGGGNGSSSAGGGGGNSSPIIKPSLGSPKTDETTTPDISATITFSDMAGYEWAKTAVEYLGAKGIISGKGDERFDPSGLVTREEFIKILVCAFDVEESQAKVDFADVASGAWYEKYVSSAVKAGIVNGISDTEFGTGKNVTRQDAAVMVSRAMNAAMQKTTTDFADDTFISDYAKSSVVWMCGQGYISGYEDNTFRPTKFCTRAEAAKIIYEIIN